MNQDDVVPQNVCITMQRHLIQLYVN